MPFIYRFLKGEFESHVAPKRKSLHFIFMSICRSYIKSWVNVQFLVKYIQYDLLKVRKSCNSPSLRTQLHIITLYSL